MAYSLCLHFTVRLSIFLRLSSLLFQYFPSFHLDLELSLNGKTFPLLFLLNAAFNCAKNPQPLEKLHKRDSFSADYIRELYSPSQAEVPAFASNTRVTVQILLMTGEQRPLEVPSNWTSEQVLIDIFGSGPECREYFFRCTETGTILYRNDLVGSYENHTLVVTPKVAILLEYFLN